MNVLILKPGPKAKFISHNISLFQNVISSCTESGCIELRGVRNASVFEKKREVQLD